MNAISRPFSGEAIEVEFDAFTDETNLLAKHNRFFVSRVANTASLRKVAYSLRYQVYCLERKFENAQEHANGLEADAFDDRAVHGILFHRPTEQAIGTVRMIQPRLDCDDSLPVSALLRDQGIDLERYVTIPKAVEISRFAISKEFRRRRLDDGAEIIASRDLRRIALREGNLACLSLIQFLLRQSVQDGVLYWTAVMEPKLLRMLAGMGIRFTSVGSLVDHHGLRQPCFCFVPDMLEDVQREHPQYWNVLTDGGELTMTSHLSAGKNYLPYDREATSIAAE